MVRLDFGVQRQSRVQSGLSAMLKNFIPPSVSATLPASMESLVAVPNPESSSPRPATVPGSVWAVLAGGTCIVVGVLWDISWHRTIGRDTFWTPAHMAIYFGGVLGGLTCGWLVIRTTFLATPADRMAAVRLWGFRGPFGAWLTIWGALAMLTSAPFDNWWHDAYGVDVKILSPPHTVLAMGMWAIMLGALFLVLREQNLAPAGRPAPGRFLFVGAAGILLVMAGIFLTEYSFPNQHRTTRFYVASAVVYPFYLLSLSRASKFRWGATWIALIYMTIMALVSWVLPLFPGQPRLGPIYNPINHFVSLPFPLLLIVPALGVDLARRWIGQGRGWRRDWLLVATAGITFMGLFLVTQWFFSAFLLSPSGQNWFFAADRHWGYREGLGDWRQKFWSDSSLGWNPPLTIKGLLLALAVSLTSSRVGLWVGNWMARVRR
jgi:hypothetical protein